jgi:glutathione synthase/RimK-type ligase-like ATP-grasp enzyme
MKNETRQKQPLLGLAKLFKMAFDGVDLSPLGQALLERARQNQDDAEALMDLSILLQLKRSPEIALGVQAQALAIRPLYHLPAERETTIKLLALMAPGDMMTNTPLEFLVEGSGIALDMLYIGPGLPFPEALPEHDLLFVAIGESAATRPLLEELAPILTQWPRPVLNLPENILKTSREAAPEHFASVKGVVMPASERMGRMALAGGKTPQFPFIVRPIGSHAGHGLAKIAAADDIPGYLETVSDQEFFVSPFVDYRSDDGLYRKYRVVLIDGRPYACHMGISKNWMIHYLNAGMLEDAEKRKEEAKFMADFDTDFGKRHQTALEDLHAAMNLDYLVIDCAETRDGKLLVFEIDTGAVVHAMDPADVFPYKVPQMKKVFSAFYDMLAGVAYECESV